MSYIQDLANISDVSFDKILRIANDNVPSSKKNAPWIGLEHGVKLLTNDDEMAQYLSAYGLMHQEKIVAALDTIKAPEDYFTKKMTIVDWGCGQGLATICFFDYLRTLGFPIKVDKVILVEPSEPAITRACAHVSKYIDSRLIHPVNKYINDVKPEDLSHATESLIIHFFSNVLDIASVDLGILSRLIKTTFSVEQLLFCVGPQNIGASRIVEFAHQFDIPKDDLIGESNGRLSVRGTVSMMTFRIKSNIPEVIKVEYYRRRSTNLGNNTALSRILSTMSPSSSLPCKTMRFYRSAVALERMKSADIKSDSLFYYPFSLDETNGQKFNIDIQENHDFEQVFVRNLNRTLTKWPKHLNIGLNIIYGDVVYRLFEYVYPFEDLKNIDIASQYITVSLSMFTISSDVADKLELTEDVSDAIEAVIQDSSATLSSLNSILVDAIGQGAAIHEEFLSLALTAEAPALAQINSELKDLDGINDCGFLSSFLSGSIRNNKVDDITEDEIINVVDMDESQRHAIQTAFNSKISVITGPPGTGKTQMIVNLLANALLKGKSVLVASKNNKAVDNIKERFDALDGYHYLVRFGSRDAVSGNVVPFLDSMMASIPNISYDPSELTSVVQEYNKRCNDIADARKYIGELIRLTDYASELKTEIQSLTDKRKSLMEAYQSERKAAELANSDLLSLAQSNISWDLTVQPFELNSVVLRSNNKGLSKIFFNLFSKKKFSLSIFKDIVSLPADFKTVVENEIRLDNGVETKDIDELLYICDAIVGLGKSIKKVQVELAEIDKRNTSAISSNDDRLSNTQKELEECQCKISILTKSKDKLLAIISNCQKYISSIGLDILHKTIKSNLVSANSRNKLARYKNYLPNNIPSSNDPTFIDDAKNFINVFKLNAVTSLSIKGSFPLSEGLFDIVVIDEASQCDIASALPLVYRAKQLVVIGDPLQLKHITSVTAADELAIKEHFSLSENPMIKYADQSLWDYCDSLITSADENNTHVILDGHYRCHPQIIGYSNELFYSRKLGITLRVCTKADARRLDEEGIIWVDVKGTQESDTKNVNKAEAAKAISIATSIAQSKQDVSIGIISPFKHQAEEINASIPKEYKDRIVSDTVHKFQGDERDVIIYSLVVTDNSPDSKIRWIDTGVPNLVNVAVTRARSALYILGNREYMRTHSRPDLPLGYLVKYTEGEASVTNNISSETVIVDTNMFVNHPDILEKIDSRKSIVIAAKVLDELDKLKVTLDDSRKRNAEQALRNINRKYESRSLRVERAALDCLPPDFSKKNPDNMILSVALKYRNQNPVLLTADNGLQLKAKGLGIKTTSIIN